LFFQRDDVVNQHLYGNTGDVLIVPFRDGRSPNAAQLRRGHLGGRVFHGCGRVRRVRSRQAARRASSRVLALRCVLHRTSPARALKLQRYQAMDRPRMWIAAWHFGPVAWVGQ
jgi:hypothetical protein